MPAPIIGEQGTAVAKLLILEMGSTWHETNPLLENGVDALIELRDPESGFMLNRWVAAQCKARQRPFDDEDEKTFKFVCEGRDLAYWADGNIPVVLVCVHPAQREAWWCPIPRDLPRGTGENARCQERVEFVFDKERDRLSPSSWRALLELADAAKEHPGKVAELPSPPSGESFVFMTLPGTELPSPAIPLELRTTEKRLAAVALLDSGAEFSCLPYSYASPLGIDLSTAEATPIHSESGQSSLHLSPVEIYAKVLDIEIQLRGIFAPTPLPLLGREDFFSRFKVTIDHQDQVVSLTPI